MAKKQTPRASVPPAESPTTAPKSKGKAKAAPAPAPARKKSPPARKPTRKKAAPEPIQQQDPQDSSQPSHGCTPELAAQICAHIANGTPVDRIAKMDGMPPASTIRTWIAEDRCGLSADSARAYAIGYEALAEECLRIADDANNDWMEAYDKDGVSVGWKLNGDHVQRSKLRIETRMRLLGKWAPKRYGDKIDVTAEIRDKTELSDVQRAARLLAIIERARAAKAASAESEPT